MGQAFSFERGYIPYDVNAWRRLSLTYLNQLNDNGEPILDENGQPIDPKNLPPRSRSRQNSFSSRNGSPFGSRHSFRVPQFSGEQPVLQEYQPKNKTNGSTSPGSGQRGNGDPGNRSPHPHRVNRENDKNQRNGADPNGANRDQYADLAFPNKKGSQSPPGGAESGNQNKNNGNKGNDNNFGAIPSRIAPGPPGGRNHKIEHEKHQREGTSHAGDSHDGVHGPHHGSHLGPHGPHSGPHHGQHPGVHTGAHNGNHHPNGSASNRVPGSYGPGQYDPSGIEYPQRSQSPKSSTTWNTTSDDFTSSTITDTVNPNWKHYESHNYLNHNNQNRDSNRSSSTGKSTKYLAPPAGPFGSRQSSGRSGKSGNHYIPYKDYYIDRTIRGENGPNSYSDFSGYSRNNRLRAPNPIGCTKWLFITFALLNIASTIWNSVYMQLTSKRMELGFSIQDKLYSMSDTQRHVWEGFIIAAQVVSNLVNIFAIYGALVERYWLIWTYTLLMFLYGMFGAVSELTRGSYTSWILPVICGQLAIVLTHQLAINRQYRKYM